MSCDAMYYSTRDRKYRRLVSQVLLTFYDDDDLSMYVFCVLDGY
jgi:hypothetical protein